MSVFPIVFVTVMCRGDVCTATCFAEVVLCSGRSLARYACFPLYEAQVKPHRKTESVKERRYVLTIKWRPRAHLKHDTVLPLEFKEERVGEGQAFSRPLLCNVIFSLLYFYLSLIRFV